MNDLKQAIKDQARRLGFTLVGVTDSEAPESYNIFEEWLNQNMHGKMNYLSEQKSRIKIEITMNKKEFQIRVVNNKVNVQQDIAERSGLGIENTKHRLNLIYPSKHLLVINDTEKEFAVSLYINLQ